MTKPNSEKFCGACKQFKPLDLFSAKNSRCKACRARGAQLDKARKSRKPPPDQPPPWIVPTELHVFVYGYSYIELSAPSRARMISLED